MIKEIVLLALYTFIPALELRFSIPMGFFTMADAVSWPMVVMICVVCNILLGWAVFWIMGPCFTFVRKWGWFERKIWPILEKTQKKIHPYVEKYGEFGVAVFIGIPLPGSGVYTGAFGSYLLGLDKKKFAIANVLGVLIAGAAVTGLCLLILNGVVAEDSWTAKMLLKLGH